MVTEPDAGRRGTTGTDEGHSWAWDDLAALDDLVRRVGDRPAGDAGDMHDLTLALELETAREELRVADEEIRAQREQLDELLALDRTSSAQRRRVASMLPVPMIATDAAGIIQHANAAAAARLNVPLVRLLGKPLLTFVHDPDRRAVRQALSEVTGEPVPLRVELTPRRAGVVTVDLVLAAEPRRHGETEVEWTIVTPGTAFEGSPPGVDPIRLAAAVADITRLPVGETETRALLGGISRAVSTALGDPTVVSVNLGSPAGPAQVASTAHAATVGDGLQIRCGEGPCVDAYEEGDTVVSDDVATDPRWGRLSALWRDCPLTAALAVPIVAGGGRVGVINCYSPGRGAFTEAQAQAVEVLALAAGATIDAVEETCRLRDLAAQLDRALDSRAVIDQAKGIVMARRGGTADEAFGHLAALSQQRNIKLRDLARALVEQTAVAAREISRRRT